MKLNDLAPHLIMMIGIPGSGKSTYIKKILSQNPEKDYVVLSTDDLIELWGQERGLNYTQAFAKLNFKQIQKQFDKKFEDALKDKKNIIIDQTNLTAKSRAKKLSLIPDDYITTGIVFKVDPEEVQKRLVKREQETGKSIPSHVVQNMVKSFEMPNYSEFDEIKIINT